MLKEQARIIQNIITRKKDQDGESISDDSEGRQRLKWDE